MKYTCVLFDLDQTLLLRTPTLPEKMQEILSLQNHQFSLDEIEKAFAECEFWIGVQTQKENQTGIRMDDETFLSCMIAIYQQSLVLSDEECRAIHPLLCRQFPRSYQLSKDAQEVLKQLSDAGVKLGIVSNNDSSVRDVLSQFGLIHFFECIVISEEVGLYKPDPAIIQLACRQCGAAAAKTLYVGDHPFDITCAHDAGADAAWIPPNRWYRLPQESCPPEYRIQRLSELLTLTSC